jgi:phthalate 4,5-dioxygenase oxygenase subunit
MLTVEENDLITKTGPGTPMGGLFRRFWLPALLADELPGPDSPPVRVEVLGERLVAFKDTEGRIGFLDRRCPHRQVDLFWGRNEEGGLRCVYHGWKFGVDGSCLDIPNALEGETFRDKIKTFAAYPGVEAGGLVWVYMGPKALKPELPGMEWLRLPSSHRHVSKIMLRANYLQLMEGDMDSSHVGFLHSKADGGYGATELQSRLQQQMFVDKMPRWELKPTDYGIMLGARREGGDGEASWRVNQWLMPSFTMIAAKPGAPPLIQLRIPVDDEHSMFIRVVWHPTRPLSDKEMYQYRDAGIFFPELIPGTFTPKENMDNDYLMDRGMQRSYSFTGIKSIPAQDFAVQENQGGGPLMDRSNEHLVSSDTAIINVRRRLIQTAINLQEGQEPLEPAGVAAANVRAVDIALGSDEAVWDGAREFLEARSW